jgi:hypothetical protein
MSMSSSEGGGYSANGFVRSPLDVGGGIFLLVLATFGFVGGFNLPFGTLSGIGSGLMPKVVATLVAAFGVLLICQGLIWQGDHLERWHARGPIFVLGAVLLFAVVIRGSTLTLGGFAGIPTLASVRVPPLGLIVAGPLTILFSSLASKETRLIEVVIFSVVMTAACGILFKEMLHLPIPFDPAGVIPSFINDLYAGLKSAIGHLFGAFRNMIGR